MTTCRHAVARGEVMVAVGDSELALVSLLGSIGVSQLDTETQAMATTLQFFRALAIGLTGDFSTTGICRGFCAALDSELDSRLGTFAEGYCWSTVLQEASRLVVAAAAGVDLAKTEAEAVADGKSRACALLAALARLYECSHVLLAESAELTSMREVLGSLLSPFAWLRPTVLRLAESHSLHDVETPEIAKAFEVLTAVPEGVPPELPEPEPEPQCL